jgi:5-methylcytosine-specific restriction endonuclease McrA
MKQRVDHALKQRQMRALNECRKLLGLGQVERQIVAEAVARAMGLSAAPSKRKQYAMLVAFSVQHYNDPALASDRARKARAKSKPSKAPRGKPAFAVTDEFLMSYEWRKLRMVVLQKFGARCQCCGATPADGVKMHVDHIKPRRFFPELALEETNLQILCEVCNHGKGNWSDKDWRPEPVDVIVGKVVPERMSFGPGENK